MEDESIKLSEEIIKHFEGFRLEAYSDSGNKWTIGYGHTGPEVHEGLKITEEEAEELFLKDLMHAKSVVEKYVKVNLYDNEKAALISFVFNVGEGAFRKSTLLAELNRGKYENVPHELYRWNKVGGQESGGLTRRRRAEVSLWNKGRDA